MFKYIYKSVTEDRKIHEGTLWAFSKNHAHKKIIARDETVVIAYRKKLDFFSNYFRISFGFSKFERILFFRNLSAMLSSGLPLTAALEVLNDQVRGAGIKKALVTISKDIENGTPLSKAMRKYPKYFSPYIVDTLHLGEITGTLVNTLDRVSVDLEKNYELSRKVTQALAYPIIILIVMVILCTILTFYVLPKIAQLFYELKAPLPIFTRILLGAGAAISGHPILFILCAVILILAIFFTLRTKKGHYAFDYMLISLPVIGKIMKEYNLVKFFRALETLVSSGISWVEGVEVAKKTLNNDLYREAIETVQPILIHGETLSQALKPYPSLFPLQTQKILAVGEQTGRFENTLKNITVYYERSLEHTTQILTSLIEPVLMIIIGVVVGGLALSIFLPIYQISNAI